MTTIAADSELKIMASDSRVTNEDGSFFLSRKVFQLPSGELAGLSGNIVDGLKFLDWYANGLDEDEKPEFGAEAFCALLLDNCGRLTIWDADCIGLEVIGRFHAIGSGANAAMGAMLAGASPDEAVAIASRIDSGTDANVVVLKIRKSDAADF
jgi:ATP-dependent protease HslVU (ClpYQ) peptidase subunit